MSRLTLRLPETLHQQLMNQASREGVSLNQYIVYALTRQATQNYTVQPISHEEVEKQATTFNNLLQELGKITPEQLTTALEERDIVAPEPELNAEIIAKFRQKTRKPIKV